MKDLAKSPSRLRWRRAFAFVVTIAGVGIGAGAFLVRETGAQQNGGGAGAAAMGSKVWTGNCATCHGLDGRGGERGPNIATNPEVVRMSDQEIEHIVREGSPNMSMPALGRTLSAAQIAAVVRHLRTLQGNQRASALPGDPKAGELLFYGKAECSSCHMVAGLGGFIAQDLTEFPRSRAAEEIRESIVHPSAQGDPRAKAAAVTDVEGKKYKGIIRNEDNFSVQLQTVDGEFHLFDRKEIASVAYEKQPLMPGDYGTRLTSGELNDIVSFLMSASRAKEAQSHGSDHRSMEDKDDE